MASENLPGAGMHVWRCDGCHAMSPPDAPTIGWEAGPFENFHTCPGCLNEDNRFVRAMGMDGWYSAEELVCLFRREDRISVQLVGRWFASAYRRGLLDRQRTSNGSMYRLAHAGRNQPPERVRAGAATEPYVS